MGRHGQAGEGESGSGDRNEVVLHVTYVYTYIRKHTSLKTLDFVPLHQSRCLEYIADRVSMLLVTKT